MFVSYLNGRKIDCSLLFIILFVGSLSFTVHEMCLLKGFHNNIYLPILCVHFSFNSSMYEFISAMHPILYIQMNKAYLVLLTSISRLQVNINGVILWHKVSNTGQTIQSPKIN